MKRFDIAVLLCIILEGCTTAHKNLAIHKPLDIIASTDRTDDNGFYKNPNWYYFMDKKKLPDPCLMCPCESDSISTWKDSANCTSQDIQINHTQYDLFFCQHGGHVNWFPIVYQGRIYWENYEYKRLGNLFEKDDDYNFGIIRDDLAMYTKVNKEPGVERSCGIGEEF